MNDAGLTEYDYIIVGGGAAGCVLANRLSGRSSNKVLLVEAGADYEPGSEPDTILDTYPRSVGVDAFKWPDMTAKARVDRDDICRLDQARVMGGCTSIMGMLALRGLPDDYDEWSQFGLDDWSWDHVLPHFKRIENDLTFGETDLHGAAGEVMIRRHGPDQWPPLCRVLRAALPAMPEIADMNGDFRDGVGWFPLSASMDQRMSAATAFLTREVRTRTNLTIWEQCEVTGLELEGRVATGVRYMTEGKEHIVKAREVILSAGALRSPVLLQKAGIGDAQALSVHGIKPVADRKGVGRNLQNHPALYVSAILKREARQSRKLRPWTMNGLRYSSGMSGAAVSDMMMFFINKSSWHAVGRNIGTIGVSVYKSCSRGHIDLCMNNGKVDGRFSLGLLSEVQDLNRLIAGVREVYRLWEHPEIARLRSNVFASPTGDLVRRLSAPVRANAILAKAFAVGMDVFPSMHNFAASMAGDEISGILYDDEALRDYVYRKAMPLCHYVGSSRMGHADDPLAVTDGSGKVIGVGNLRVVDGGILPTVPRANTNIPITMVADRISAKILAGF